MQSVFFAVLDHSAPRLLPFPHALLYPAAHRVESRCLATRRAVEPFLSASLQNGPSVPIFFFSEIR